MSESQPENASKAVVRSNDFRYIPSDSISVALNEVGAKLVFGVDEVDGTVCELMGVHMSLQDAASFRDLLDEGLKHIEEKQKAESKSAE